VRNVRDSHPFQLGELRQTCVPRVSIRNNTQFSSAAIADYSFALLPKQQRNYLDTLLTGEQRAPRNASPPCAFSWFRGGERKGARPNVIVVEVGRC
jgi:hypothetical protein